MRATAVAMPITTAIEAVQVRIVTTEADKEMISEWVTGTMTEKIKTKIKGLVIILKSKKRMTIEVDKETQY
jgi:hypothetical protein